MSFLCVLPHHMCYICYMHHSDENSLLVLRWAKSENPMICVFHTRIVATWKARPYFSINWTSRNGCHSNVSTTLSDVCWWSLMFHKKPQWNVNSTYRFNTYTYLCYVTSTYIFNDSEWTMPIPMYIYVVTSTPPPSPSPRSLRLSVCACH